jgi:hypothetical protein
MTDYPILSRLSSYTSRAVAFFFASSALITFFFLVGNDQEFLESTQSLLLRLLSASLALELACSAASCVFLARRTRLERRPFVLRWVLLLLSLVLSLGLLVGLHWLRSWLRV